MGATNATTNLELSQFIGSDSPKWLTDYNGDMEKIDAGYGVVKAQADATDLVVSGHTSSISSLTTTTGEQTTSITNLRTDVNTNTGSINTINSLIGNGTPTTTDQTLIGAINELHADITGDTEADTVSYDNTVSGLTATNVQAAIDELDSEIGSLDHGSVMVTADGTKTYKTLLNELFALVDVSKVRDTTYLKMVTAAGGTLIYHINFYASNLIRFGSVYNNFVESRTLSASDSVTVNIQISSGGSITYTDESNNAVPNDYSLYIVY